MMRPQVGWALTAAGCCAAIFLVLALAASGSAPPRFDRTIENHVHWWVVARPPWPVIGRGAGLITEPTNLRIAALLAAAGLFANRRWSAGAWLLATMTVSGVLGVVLKLIFARPRPVWTDPISVVSGYSFPSGHALNSAAAAGCVLILLSMVPARTARTRHWIIAWSACALLFTLAAGIDRVMVGVHYPSDVVAGWAAGACVVLLMWCTLPMIQEPITGAEAVTKEEL